MARAKPGPEERMEALREERERIAVERDEITGLLRVARGALREVPDRTRAAQVAKARGRAGEALAAIAADAERLGAEVDVLQLRLGALTAAEGEIATDSWTVVEENLEHYTDRARQASAAATEAAEMARSAITGSSVASRAAVDAWVLVSTAGIRMGREPLPAVPVSDHTGLLFEWDKAMREPWPGGRPPEDAEEA